MHLWIRLYVKWNGVCVGRDIYGNIYYREKKHRRDVRARRFVVYNGVEEASKVPALWHAWLHYITDEIPESIKDRHFFDKKLHRPNLTGTSMKHNPYQAHFHKDGTLKKPDYIAWIPE